MRIFLPPRGMLSREFEAIERECVNFVKAHRRADSGSGQSALAARGGVRRGPARGRGAAAAELRLYQPGPLFRGSELGEGRERHAQAVLRPRLRQGGDSPVGAGLHPLRRPAQPVRGLGLRAKGADRAVSRALRGLLDDGGVAHARLTSDRRLRGEKSCSADELALLLGGAAVPLPAGIRQRAPAHQPVDGDGRGCAHPRRHGAGALRHLRDPRAHRGRRA